MRPTTRKKLLTMVESLPPPKNFYIETRGSMGEALILANLMVKR